MAQYPDLYDSKDDEEEIKKEAMDTILTADNENSDSANQDAENNNQSVAKENDNEQEMDKSTANQKAS